MYEGNPVDLQMEKVISADAIFDDTTRVCKVDHYDTEEDYIYLEVMEDPLTTMLYFNGDRAVVLLRCCEREIPVGRQESTEV